MTFAPGIYYGQPIQSSQRTVLRITDGDSARRIPLGAPGFDVRHDAIAFTDGANVILVEPDGNKRTVSIPGLFEIVRPSFSPDGTKIVVQAKEVRGGDLDIYVINLDTGEVERISYLDVNEESPEWFPTENNIAYSSFDPAEGLTLHIYDLDEAKEVLAIRDAGWIHLAVSPDGSLIFNPILGRLYDATTGDVISDLMDRVVTALDDLGYKPDTRYPGQAGYGTFPLDADFSPDGGHIVIDGAVEFDGAFGMMIFQMTITGDDLTPLTGIIEIDPTMSNNNNFSQLNPSWLGN